YAPRSGEAEIFLDTLEELGIDRQQFYVRNRGKTAGVVITYDGIARINAGNNQGLEFYPADFIKNPGIVHLRMALALDEVGELTYIPAHPLYENLYQVALADQEGGAFDIALLDAADLRIRYSAQAGFMAHRVQVVVNERGEIDVSQTRF